MKIKQIVAVLVLTMSLAEAAFSQSSANDFSTRLTTYVTETHNQLNYDYGMAVAVVKGDEIIYEGYFGTSDFSNHQKVEANDSFYIASSTKPLVALAAMRLAEKGMLDLEKSLSSYFPEVAFAAEVQADKIKLTHLINHTSGIDNYAIAHSAAYTGLHTPELHL